MTVIDHKGKINFLNLLFKMHVLWTDQKFSQFAVATNYKGKIFVSIYYVVFRDTIYRLKTDPNNKFPAGYGYGSNRSRREKYFNNHRKKMEFKLNLIFSYQVLPSLFLLCAQ
jgi:hypothetical protein